jgi:hypothetical protein
VPVTVVAKGDDWIVEPIIKLVNVAPANIEPEKLPVLQIPDDVTSVVTNILPLNDPEAKVEDPETYNGFFGLLTTFDSLPEKLDINDVFGITDDVSEYAYHLLPE